MSWSVWFWKVLSKLRMHTCTTNQVCCDSGHAQLSQHLPKPRIPVQIPAERPVMPAVL